MEAERVSPGRLDSVFQLKRCLMPSHGSCCGLWQQERCRGSLGQGNRSDAGRPECWRESYCREVIVVSVHGDELSSSSSSWRK